MDIWVETMAADSTSCCYGQNRIHRLKQLRLFPFLLGRVRLELEMNSFCKEYNGQGKSYTRGKKFILLYLDDYWSILKKTALQL